MRGQEGIPTTAHAKSSRAGHRPRDLFFVNLFWSVLLGVVVLFWVSRFTNFLEVVIAALGFGGVLAWIPFLGNMVGGDRKKQLQGRFEFIFQQRKTSIFLGLVTVVLLAVGSSFGCVVIDAREDSQVRKVVIHKSTDSPTNSGDTQRPADCRVSPGSEARFPVWAGWRGGRYEIDVDGLPLIQRDVPPWFRVRLVTPRDFLSQSVVLVRADPLLSRTSTNPKMQHRVKITLDGKDVNDIEFEGRPFWIGCRSDVAIPAPLKEEWRLEVLSWWLQQRSNLPSSCVETILALWLAPNAVGGISELKSGQTLTIRVYTAGTTATLAEGSTVIRPCRSAKDFPQIIYLKSGPQ